MAKRQTRRPPPPALRTNLQRLEQLNKRLVAVKAWLVGAEKELRIIAPVSPCEHCGQVSEEDDETLQEALTALQEADSNLEQVQEYVAGALSAAKKRPA